MRKPAPLLPINAWQPLRCTSYSSRIFVMLSPIQQGEMVGAFFRGESGRVNYDRLVAYADKSLVGLCFQGPWATTQGPEYYANEAFRRCMPDAQGKCDRNLDGPIPLWLQFQGVVDSLISHDSSPSGARKKTWGLLGATSENDGPRDRTADDFYVPMWDDKATPRMGESLDDKAAITRFKAFIQSDIIVFQIVNLLLEEDIDEPAELVAQRIGIKVSEVYAARRRFERLCRQFAMEGQKL